MRNPILEESRQLIIHRREYLLLHVIYLAVSALFVVLLWPTRGYVHFFRTAAVPSVFEATVIFQVIVLSVVSLYAGMDRFAPTAVIRYSEWLEHTALPVQTLITGKMITAFVHSLFLVLIAAPFTVVAGGPAGMPASVVSSSMILLFLTTLGCRIAGMLISYVGENRYVVRVIGSWVFLALLYVATVQIVPSLNPIVALVRQQLTSSPLLEVGARVPLADHPILIPTVCLVSLILFLSALYTIALFRHSRAAKEHLSHA